MKKFFLKAGALLIVWAAAPAVAAPLSLEQVLLLAEKNSPALKLAASRSDGARAALDTARAYPNPDIEFGAGKSRLYPVSTPGGRNTLLAFSQPVELPGLREAKRRGAEAGMAAGDALLDDARVALYAKVRQSYLDVVRSEEEARLASENHALLKQIRDRVKLRAEVGESPRYEFVKSEAELLNARSIAKSAEIRVDQAKGRLRALMGVPFPESFETVSPRQLAADLPDIKKLRAELLEKQPALRLYAAESARAAARLDQERNLRIPQPTLRLSAERHPDVSLWRVGLSMPLPLWDRRKGPIGEATANFERAKSEEESVRLGLLGELEQAYGRYQIAKRQLDIFEKGLLREAEAAVKVAEAGYRFGERGILDYLDAQRVYRNTRIDYLNARYELQFALIDIDRLRAIPGEVK